MFLIGAIKPKVERKLKSELEAYKKVLLLYALGLLVAKKLYLNETRNKIILYMSFI